MCLSFINVWIQLLREEMVLCILEQQLGKYGGKNVAGKLWRFSSHLVLNNKRWANKVINNNRVQCKLRTTAQYSDTLPL
jgi:hypothetical protein